MKISKLFHWLYAVLMLLPFAFFVPSVLYYAFNDNATMQSVEVPKTETIGVNFSQKVSENTYFAYQSYMTFEGGGIGGRATCTSGTDVRSDGSAICKNIPLNSNVLNHIGIFKFDFSSNVYECQPMIELYFGRSSISFEYRLDNHYELRFTFNSSPLNNSSLLLIKSNSSLNIGDYYDFSNIQLFDLTDMFGSGNEPTLEEFNLMFPNAYYPYAESELKQITYETGTTEQLIENTSIINYAWESIWDLPLFSWTKVTFVSVPFSYLTGIFGICASNSLNYVFGYFVTISVVWLVFDLLLYVPMLAHNWIDKARIE